MIQPIFDGMSRMEQGNLGADFHALFDITLEVDSGKELRAFVLHTRAGTLRSRASMPQESGKQ